MRNVKSRFIFSDSFHECCYHYYNKRFITLLLIGITFRLLVLLVTQQHFDYNYCTYNYHYDTAGGNHDKIRLLGYEYNPTIYFVNSYYLIPHHHHWVSTTTSSRLYFLQQYSQQEQPSISSDYRHHGRINTLLYSYNSPNNTTGRNNRRQSSFHPHRTTNDTIKSSPPSSSSSSSSSLTKNKTTVSFETRWNTKYQELLHYKSIHGDCNVPQSYEPNPSLGRWVRNQRVEYASLIRSHGGMNNITAIFNSNNHYNNNVMSNTNHHQPSSLLQNHQSGIMANLPQSTIDRIQQLNEIGFIWDMNEATWNRRFKDLLQFKQLYGHVLVPQTWDETDQSLLGKKWRILGPWVRNQRVQYRNRRKAEMAKGEGEHSIGKSTNEIPLTTIITTTTTTNIVITTTILSNINRDNSAINNNDRKGTSKYFLLTDERIQILDNIGFCWDARKAVWMERYNELCQYKAIHGHVDVSSSSTSTNSKNNDGKYDVLARWVTQQRNAYRQLIKKGIIQQQQQEYDSLNQSNIVVNTKKRKSNTSSKNKQESATTTNNDSINDRPIETNFDLQTQKLTPEKINLLNDLGFCWDVRDTYWWEQYQSLCEFHSEYGHCVIPSNHPNVKLRNWVANQRRLCNDYCRIYFDSGIIHCGSDSNSEETKLKIVDEGGEGDQILKDVVKEPFIISGLNSKRINALRKLNFPGLYSLSTLDVKNSEAEESLSVNDRDDDSNHVTDIDIDIKKTSWNNVYESTVKETRRKTQLVDKNEKIAKSRQSTGIMKNDVIKTEQKQDNFIPFPWDEI